MSCEKAALMLSSRATFAPADNDPDRFSRSGSETSTSDSPERANPEIGSTLLELESMVSVGLDDAGARRHLVQRVLGLLGWPLDEIRSRQVGGSRDYLSPALGFQHSFVVVAKQHSATFRLHEKYRNRRYKLSTLVTHGGKRLSALVDHAIVCCQQTGSPYGVVTNGPQWILFRALSYSGGKGRNRIAVVFNGWADLRENFSELEQYLSRSRQDDSALEQEFEEPLAVPAYCARPCSDLGQRSPVLKEKKGVALLFDQYLGDIARPDDPGMLERCFVEDAALRDHVQTLRKALDERSSGGPPRVGLVVGAAGAGKSTFLARFLERLKRAEALCLLVDLHLPVDTAAGEADARSERLSSQILQQLADGLASEGGRDEQFDPFAHSTLRAVFAADVERLERGPFARVFALDPGRFEEAVASLLSDLSSQACRLLPAFLQHVRRTTSLPFCLVFDGLEHATEEEAGFVCLFAQRLAEEINGLVVLSLRDRSYALARRAGALDSAGSGPVVSVEPPDLRDVLTQRLHHFRHHVSLENKFYAALGSGGGDSSETVRAPKNVQSQLAGMAPIVTHLSEMFLGPDRGALEMLARLGNRSIKPSFGLLRGYAGSAHAWSGASGLGGRSRVLQCLMLQNQQFYSELSSPILNLFQVPKDKGTSHFSSLAVLSVLKWHRDNRAGVEDEPSLRDLSRELAAWGLAPSALWAIVTRLASKNLVELHQESLLQLTPAGFYLLSELAADDLYHLHCAYETRWYEEEPAAAFTFSLRAALGPNGVAIDKALRESDCLRLWKAYLSRAYAWDSKSWSAAPRPWHKELRAFAQRAKLTLPPPPKSATRALEPTATMQLDLDFS